MICFPIFIIIATHTALSSAFVKNCSESNLKKKVEKHTDLKEKVCFLCTDCSFQEDHLCKSTSESKEIPMQNGILHFGVVNFNGFPILPGVLKFELPNGICFFGLKFGVEYKSQSTLIFESFVCSEDDKCQSDFRILIDDFELILIKIKMLNEGSFRVSYQTGPNSKPKHFSILLPCTTEKEDELDIPSGRFIMIHDQYLKASGIPILVPCKPGEILNEDVFRMEIPEVFKKLKFLNGEEDFPIVKGQPWWVKKRLEDSAKLEVRTGNLIQSERSMPEMTGDLEKVFNFVYKV